MPDGTPVPQVSQYKWLGFYVTGRWRGGRDTDRATAISKAKACITMACRLPELSWDEIGETISTGLTGILGYRARGVCIRWEDAQEIEKARAAGLVQRGVICGVPRLQMYETGAGMGHEHAYCVAAASFVDEIDRMLCGHRGAPARGVAEACIAKTCYRLGCRTAPLEWMPHYMTEELDDEMIGEAWLKIKLRAQLYAGQSRLRDSGALSSDREAWKPEASAGPGLWESAAGTWGRRGEKATVGYGREAKRLAAIGIVQWGHVTNMDTGKILTWNELRARYPDALDANGLDYEAYQWLNERLTAPGKAEAMKEWQNEVLHEAAGCGRAHVPNREGREHWRIEKVISARRTATELGGWEYLVRWAPSGAGGEPIETWELHDILTENNGIGGVLREAREKRYQPASMREALMMAKKQGKPGAKEAVEAAEESTITDHRVGKLWAYAKEYMEGLKWGEGGGEQGGMPETPMAQARTASKDMDGARVARTEDTIHNKKTKD